MLFDGHDDELARARAHLSHELVERADARDGDRTLVRAGARAGAHAKGDCANPLPVRPSRCAKAVLSGRSFITVGGLVHASSRASSSSGRAAVACLGTS